MVFFKMSKRMYVSKCICFHWSLEHLWKPGEDRTPGLQTPVLWDDATKSAADCWSENIITRRLHDSFRKIWKVSPMSPFSIYLMLISLFSRYCTFSQKYIELFSIIPIKFESYIIFIYLRINIMSYLKVKKEFEKIVFLVICVQYYFILF